MIRSMTGYGRGQATREGITVNVEMKSVNHRFLEIAIRLPRSYFLLEELVRNRVKKQLSRGRVEIFCNIEVKEGKERQVKLDSGLAIAYHNCLKDLAKMLGNQDHINTIEVARFPEVLKVEEEETAKVEVLLDKALNIALDQLLEMRRREGDKLAEDLLERGAQIRESVDQIYRRLPAVADEYRNRLQERVQELASCLGLQVNEDRLVLEVVLFAERSNITEELVRLKSHLDQLVSTLRNENKPAGRKLDFLLQEMNREINTIGSKSADREISCLVVEIKGEMEKIREQVQNIE